MEFDNYFDRLPSGDDVNLWKEKEGGNKGE
jgi:hypothetical protein